jgi:hypothetical protein
MYICLYIEHNQKLKQKTDHKCTTKKLVSYFKYSRNFVSIIEKHNQMDGLQM